MSEEVAIAVRKLALSDLMTSAQRRAAWIEPRWSNRTDLWLRILAGVDATEQRPSTTLQLLQLNATKSSRLLALAGGNPAERRSEDVCRVGLRRCETLTAETTNADIQEGEVICA
jgi:hypothetical protein